MMPIFLVSAVALALGFWLGGRRRDRRELSQWERGYEDGLKVGKFAATYSGQFGIPETPEGDGPHPLGHQTFHISAASEIEAFCRLTAPPRGR